MWKSILRPTLAFSTLATLFILTGCGNDAPPTRTEYQVRDAYSGLQDRRGPIPVALDGIPESLTDDLYSALSDVEIRFSATTPITFAVQAPKDPYALALRVVYQPSADFTSISMCQGKSITDATSGLRNLTFVAVLCDNGRRLVSVRGTLPAKTNRKPEEPGNLLYATIQGVFGLSFSREQ